MNHLLFNHVKLLLLTVLSCTILSCDRSSTEASSTNKQKAGVSKSLSATGAYMLSIAPGQTRAAVYLTLVNAEAKERAITLVSTDIAGYAEVHNHIHENGVMSMRKVNHPKIAANSTLAFTSGGYHIMLFDVAQAPPVGSQFELVLAFDRAETMKIKVEVRSVH